MLLRERPQTDERLCKSSHRAAHIQTLYSPRRAALTLEAVRRRHKSSHLNPGAGASARSRVIRRPAPPLLRQHRLQSPSRCPRLPVLPKTARGTTHHRGAPSLRGAPRASISWVRRSCGFRPRPGLHRFLQGYVPVDYRAMRHNGDCRCVSRG
jgi:hypothetical protein